MRSALLPVEIMYWEESLDEDAVWVDKETSALLAAHGAAVEVGRISDEVESGSLQRALKALAAARLAASEA